MNLQKWNRIEGAFALNAASMNLPLKIAGRFRLSPPLSVSEYWFGQTGGRRGCQDFGITIRQMEKNSRIVWRFHTISRESASSAENVFNYLRKIENGLTIANIY